MIKFELALSETPFIDNEQKSRLLAVVIRSRNNAKLVIKVIKLK